MHCKKVRTYFLEMLDGTLDAILRNALNHHLARCDSCRQECARTEKFITAWKDAPAPTVPDSVWEAITAQTAQLRDASKPAPERWQRLAQWIADVLEEGAWGRKAAFSSAIAALLLVSVFWGPWSSKQPATLQVIELPGNAVSAFPSYFREHHNPAAQPITDATMVLAFNTSGDNR